MVMINGSYLGLAGAPEPAGCGPKAPHSDMRRCCWVMWRDHTPERCGFGLLPAFQLFEAKERQPVAAGTLQD
jgi:hypothetical protein